ncbi:MAG: type II secretion system F family protein [Pseudomonadota bacterium]
MTLFRYSSIGPDGTKISGRIDADSADEAQRFVSGAGEFLVDLSPVAERRWLKLERQKEIKLHVAGSFAIELAGLIEAGAPLDKALTILSEGTTPSARLSRAILAHIESGRSFSVALREAGGACILLAEFVSAGEAGVGLSTMLHTGGTFLTTRSEAARKTRSALAYPTFIAILALAALIIMIVYVAPTLAPTLEDSESNAVFLKLAGIGSWVQGHNTEVLLGIATILSIGAMFGRTGIGQNISQSLAYTVPIIGNVNRDLSVGQAMEVTAALLESGRPLSNALEFAGNASSPAMASIFHAIADRLKDGCLASTAFEEADSLPHEVRRLAKLGETTGAFAKALRQSGRICHQRAMLRLDRLSALAGPVLVIGIGGMVAGLMLTVLGSLSGIGGGAL